MQKAFGYGVVGFLVGVALGTIGILDIFASVFIGILGLSIYVVDRIYTHEERFAKGLILLITFLCAVAFGGIRFGFANMHQGDPILNEGINHQVTVEGVVVREPIQKENYQQLVIEVQTLQVATSTENISGKVLVFADRHPVFVYGDVLRIQGTVTEPEAFTTDTGREFDYKNFLAKDGIWHMMRFPHIEHIATGKGNHIFEWLFSFKQVFLQNIRELIPQPHVALLGGLVVGAQEAMSKELLDDFRKTGIIHIVVLSGYNVSIIAEAIGRILVRIFPLVVADSFGVLSIALFALMTGASATTIRASIMAILVILARRIGRRYDITRALIIAGLLMVLHNPRILLFDPSFQLSFIATLGLIQISPYVEEKLSWIPERFQLRTIVSATIATQLAVLPLLLYMTGELSVVAIFVNILVLGVIPLTMLFGFVTGALAFVFSPLGIPFSFLTFGLLEYILTIIDWFARLPFASLSIPILPLWAVFFWYGVYALLLKRYSV